MKLNGFRVSPYLQDHVLNHSQLLPYDTVSTLLEKTLRLKISDTMCHRMVQTYGTLVHEEVPHIELGAKAAEVSALPTQGPSPSKDVVYAMADGSMLFTDNGWQEVKAGRFFAQDDCRVTASGARGSITRSLYVAHLGACEEFKSKYSPLLESYQHLGEDLVWISDGAVWMGNWVQETFPKATSILDFWHPTDRLAKFAALHIPNGPGRAQWLETNKLLVLDNRIDEVIRGIRELVEQKTDKDTQILINYLDNNRWRMDYKTYKAKGLFIGSGAMESTNKSLVQQRMKRSGQRWSDKGAQNLLNLRVCAMSNNWNLVTQFFKPKHSAPLAD